MEWPLSAPGTEKVPARTEGLFRWIVGIFHLTQHQPKMEGISD